MEPFTIYHSPFTIRIGTRASKLALAQAEIVKQALLRIYTHCEISIVAMTTAGDRELHKTMADWGYKGLFTKELEDALLDGRIDIAVHSIKDMPSILPDGLAIGAVLPRADIRDAWISSHYATIAEVPQGATVGTSSTRRAAQLLNIRPDLALVPFRGNVQTRLDKLAAGVAVGTFLAAAGLVRLGLTDQIRCAIEPEEMLPAAAQGAIGIEYQASQNDIAAILTSINHADTNCCITAERAMLRALDGSCRTPIGGLAILRDNALWIRGEVLSLDGTIRHTAELTGAPGDAEILGKTLGDMLRAKAGDALLKQLCQ